MSSKILAGRYELIEKIGEGGMAIVYKAKCRLLNRFVAIKILKPEFVKDAKFIESFRRESQAAASLSHPNIVNVYDVGKEGNIYYIVMELIDGEVLSDIINRDGALPESQAVSIVKQIASALSLAHRNHIIHRDVKPHNILITNDGTAKITDFGIAKAVNSATIVNNTSTIMGSVHYFSPEQARGGYVDEKSDIYSLGIVLYEMATGKVPFDADNPVSVAIMHINNEIQPPSQLNPNISQELEDIILKATEKYQTNRYKTADEMLDALEKYGQRSSAEPKVILGDDYEASVADNGRIMITIREEGQDKMEKTREKDSIKPKKKIRISKVKAAAIILALICAIPASQLVLAVVTGGFAEKDVTVPDLTGMTIAEAETKLEEIGLKYEVDSELYDSEYAAGEIMSQDPSADMAVKEGYTIQINISKGVKEGSIPNLTNKSLEDAAFTLENYGFVQGGVTIQNSELPKNFVISQSPAAGTPAAKGTAVDMVVSDGLKTAQISMPNLIGMNVEAAKQEIIKAGLLMADPVYEYSNVYALNVVMNQAVPAGTEVARDTAVVLTVSKGEGNASGNGSITITIPYDRAQNEIFYLTVYNGTDKVIDSESRNRFDGSETITLSGEGVSNILVYFDSEIIMDVNVDFATGEIN